jgi:hypothetical protein
VVDSVKSQPKDPGVEARRPVRPIRHYRLRNLALLGFSAAIVTLSSQGGAQSLLLGPAAQRAKARVEIDPRLPSGALRHSSLSLPIPSQRACSTTLPICVAGRPSRNPGTRTPVRPDGVVPTAVLGKALSFLEEAYRRLVYAAGLPEPRRAWEPRFGSPALTWELTGTPWPLAVDLSPIAGSTFESAAVVCRSGVADGDSDESLERDAFLCVGEAIASRLDAAESPRSRRAYAEALWWELGRPGTADILEIARANDTAYRASVGRDETDEATSTALLFEHLEQTLGTAKPYGLITGLFALSAEPRQLETARYVNEPDWLDILRESLGDDRGDFAQRMNAFAAARAMLGSTTGPLARLAWAGRFARIRPDWELAVSSLPRRVACRKPLGPLGTVAMRVIIDVPTKNLSLAIHAEWEGPGPFAWTAVKLDGQDQQIGRLDLAFEPRVTSAEKRLVALDGVRALLVLGTNLGGIDATHLLDPDHAPFEPHGCTLYVVQI